MSHDMNVGNVPDVNLRSDALYCYFAGAYGRIFISFDELVKPNTNT
jgi:hypothetical protein